MNQTESVFEAILNEEINRIEDRVTISNEAKNGTHNIGWKHRFSGIKSVIARKNRRKTIHLTSASVKSQLFGFAGHNPYGT